ncbi:MAG: N-6 DNA methylase [Chloroflexi bacterium]|nr:N-6 DNA methylase [Chloroflexota bacterium]
MNAQTRFTKEITKALRKVEPSGNRPSAIFEDWIQLVEACLEAIPAHLRATEEEPFQETPETAALFERMRVRYNERYFAHFAEAMALLIQSATVDYMDVLGLVYMNYAYPKKSQGQYFTPWNVAHMMAKMTINPDEIEIRLKEAINKSIIAQALLMAGLVLTDPDEMQRHMMEKVLPLALPHFEPLTVCDPCCGSGIMFLAAAKCLPRWAVQLGLVQFYGQDIDQTCVRMANINSMLYGLNGRSLESVLAMEEKRYRGLVPEPWQPYYDEAREADERGDDGRVREIADALRQQKAAGQQMPLFEPGPVYHTGDALVEEFFTEVKPGVTEGIPVPLQVNNS